MILMSNHVVVIAEVGVNHNGDLELAKQLISLAAEAGADYVKFQTFKPDSLVTKAAEAAPYQRSSLEKINSQHELLSKYELSDDDHHELIENCNREGIKFLSSAFDLHSVRYLHSLGMELFKVPSGEITNYPYLEMVGQFANEVYLSSGMSNLDEISAAIEVLETSGCSRKRITVLQCNTAYPTPLADVNLRAMATISQHLDVKVGYSDHTLGYEIAIAAVAMGAQVIEKHFTLNRTSEGPDHKASLEPDELKQMIISIRNVELALGNAEKNPTESELQNLQVVRKSIVAARSINIGEQFSSENITTKRPGNGISAMRWNEILGQVANRNFEIDDLIEI
jgi:N,N'-diacetyllegionaminate synthase